MESLTSQQQNKITNILKKMGISYNKEPNEYLLACALDKLFTQNKMLEKRLTQLERKVKGID